jgi:soluble P-type ATPase
MERTIKVGVMPGKINEFVVEVGTTITDVLVLAGLDPSGYDVKVDGVKSTDLNRTVVEERTNLVLLAKQVKGNSERTIKVGVMPGKINEFVVEIGTTVTDVLALAGLDASGYDVKVDGIKVTDLSRTLVGERTNLVLLAKQVKGNSERTVKVGVMPGKINEFVVEVGTTITDVLALAQLDASGYDVKVDGVKITDLDRSVIGDRTNLVLLAKQVKGNR